MKAKKIAAGTYEYRGYLIEKQESEYGNEWMISEMTAGGWFVCDQFSTLRDCKYFIDLWKATE